MKKLKIGGPRQLAPDQPPMCVPYAHGHDAKRAGPAMMLLPPALRLLAKAIVGGWLVYLHASWLGWHFQQPTAGTWTVVLHDDGGTAIEMGRAASDGVAATFTDAAEALLRISARAGDAEQADAWAQLAWQYNKVALDQAEEHKPRGAHHTGSQRLGLWILQQRRGRTGCPGQRRRTGWQRHSE